MGNMAHDMVFCSPFADPTANGVRPFRFESQKMLRTWLRIAEKKLLIFGGEFDAVTIRFRDKSAHSERRDEELGISLNEIGWGGLRGP